MKKETLKENLKRLKALLLAITMCLTLSACSKKNEVKTTDNETIVIFLQGKALIYNGEYNIALGEEYVGIGGTALKYDEITRFSSGADAVLVKSREDAIELASAIVGEENIIYIDYKDEDMQLTYTKTKK